MRFAGSIAAALLLLGLTACQPAPPAVEGAFATLTPAPLRLPPATPAPLAAPTTDTPLPAPTQTVTPADTPSPAPTLTATATETPGPTATPSLTPTITPTPVCDCSCNRYDCKDFASHAAAQACYEFCGSGDVHHLDGDADGLACETLP